MYESREDRDIALTDLERISLAIEPDLLRRFDRLLAESGVANRSEVVRDLRRLATQVLGLEGVPHGGLVASSLDVLSEGTR